MNRLLKWNAGPLMAALMAAATLGTALPSKAAEGFYFQRNLVYDVPHATPFVDPNLVNPWGLAFNPFGFVWVADNGTGVSTLYDGTGRPQSLVVRIPTPANTTGKSKPTGIVYNGSRDFVVSNQAGASGPSVFIFATEQGVIAGWAPNVDLTHAIRVVDKSISTGAIYKGLALSANGTGNRLYAADFHNARIDVFDREFKPVTLPAGAFVDPSIPAGFAPFNIQAIQGDLYVAYAKQDAAKEDEVRGKGLGYVDVFDPNGKLLKRVAADGPLNAPWGLALAPAGFGRFSGRLLVGNFGDGTINAYDVTTGSFVGKLTNQRHEPVQIIGLWGLAFGNGLNNQPVNTLFFTAGPADEKHGLYGRIEAVPETNLGP